MANFSRSLSRRNSLPYASQGGYQTPYHDAQYPAYHDQGYSYSDGCYPEHDVEQFPSYGHGTSHRLTGPSYENFGDSYYPEDDHRMIGYSTSRPPSRTRRHSNVSYSALPPAIADGGYHSPSSMNIKFKRKGALLAGVSLADAQSTRTRLSGNDSYTLQDLHANWSRRIHLRVRWSGYGPLTYEVPLDVYDGRVSMQALARRVARACVHYLQMNMVPVMYSRVELHHLEEVAYGVWQPMLSTR
ncbi:unnamed protein product [Mycena citricolor]|uniref:DUF6741 domain-containing protein n=1 Tax=Mycena citricolor TaxID=2018698 RepID=A0AAD2HHR1_9AGAR|nr:unnamed protein product [Mycena citricolor]